ncbi:MAG: chloride channel protein [Caldilineaceae bacterium]|nr:chloride channel protein [Caldilineaceae bacterium]
MAVSVWDQKCPTGMLGAGLGSWLSERRKLSQESSKTNVLSGVMGAYGGLFTSPFMVMLIPLESRHNQRVSYYGTLIIAALAGVVGFILFYVPAGGQFASLLGMLDLPVYSVEVWHLFAAIGMGVLGAVLAVIFGVLVRLLRKVAAPMERRPVVRSTLAGLLLGLLGFALPLTLFLGTEGLQTVTTEGAQLGVALLVVVLFAKMVALAGALAGGFIGGPIFPLLFVGGTAGVVINLLFPAVPLALAVGCMMAAVPGGLLPVPLALSVIVLVLAGIPATEAIPIPIAALTAFMVTYGILGLGDRKAESGPDEPEAAGAAPAEQEVMARQS